MGEDIRREAQGFEAPEVDLAAHAPEFYRRVSDGLQVQNGVGPELSRSREPGIVINENDLPEVIHEKPTETKSERLVSAIYYRSVWLAVVSVALVIVVALSVGLGVGLKNSSSDTSLSSTSISQSNLTSRAFTLGAMNDTSLAAVSTPDGNRHVFLQDINGTLRHAVFSSVANLWLPDADYLIPSVPVSPPRFETPITTTYFAEYSEDILVYYVNVDNTLSAISYRPGVGVVGRDTFNGSIAVKPDSRCISAATIEERANDGFLALYASLFFEAPSGNITFLHGRSLDNFEWQWQNMSEVLNLALWRDLNHEKASLGCPCTSGALQIGRTSNDTKPTDVQAAFFNLESLANASAPLTIGIDISNATEADSLVIARSDFFELSSSESALHTAGTNRIWNSSDIIAPYPLDHSLILYSLGLGLVVNGTLQLTDAPESKFPFGRLAWLNSNTSSSLFIYHQVNESALAEEESIDGVGWITRLITVSTE